MPRIGIGIGAALDNIGGAGGAPLAPVYLRTVSSAPVVAFGTVRLINGYNGPAERVLGITDDNETDIPFNGRFRDNAALAAHKAAHGVCQSRLIYDQSGNGFNPGQATKVNQPVSDPSILYGGCPAISFDSSPLAIGPRSKNMNNAVGPVTDKANFTTFVLLVPSFSFNDNYIYCQPPGATTVSLFTQSTNVGIRGNNTSPFNSTRLMPFVQPIVLTWMGSSAGKTFGINETEQLVATAPAAGTVTGIELGKHVSTASFDGEYDLIAFVQFPTALPLNERQGIRSDLYAQVPNFKLTANNLILGGGNSRTEGSGHIWNQTWFKALVAGVSKSAFGINVAVGGQTLDAEAAAVAARINALYDPTKNNIVILGDPVNDFTAGGLGASAAAQADLLAEVGGMNVNQKLVVITCGYRDTWNATQINEWNDYNTWLRANYNKLQPGTGTLVAGPTATRLADIGAAFPSWDAINYIDVVHYWWGTSIGQGIWLNLIKAEVEPLLI